MTTYRNIHGRAIQSLSTDPTESVAEGQIWYNTSSDTFKSVVSLEAFTSSSLMGTGRYQGGWAGSAPQTASLYFAGRTAAPAVVALTEEYNGSGWSTSGNCNNAENASAGFGTQTAAVKTGGYPGSGPTNSNESEEYNGSSWTTGNNINPQRQGHAGAGTLTAGVIFGGTDGTLLNKTEEYDGTNFSNVNNMNTARNNLSGNGSQTTAIAAGGGTPSITTATEVYDGTNWTTVGSMNTARQGMGGFGDSSASVIAGGSAPYKSAVETWDGTSWSTSPATLATARTFFGDCGSGTSTAGLVAGGIISPGVVALTEEYNKSTNVITAGAWSSGTSLPSVRWNTTGAGIQTAGLVFGGSTGPALPAFLNTTFEYDGSSWTGGGATPINSINQFGAGIQTAAIGGGGLASPGSNTTTAYTYDGSSWTAITGTPIATKGAGAAGTSTACLIYGSDVPDSAMNQDSYLWNGSSWAEEGALNASFQNGAAGGPAENTAFKAGSAFGSPEVSTNFETYNGSAWTAGPALITAVQQNRGMGSSAGCFSIGGYNKITTVEKFNGTAWQTSPSLATGRKQFASANFTAPGVSNGWVGGGADGDASVEHFTEETSSVTSKTLTTS